VQNHEDYKKSVVAEANEVITSVATNK